MPGPDRSNRGAQLSRWVAMVHVIRWILILPAAIAAWMAAFVIGIVIQVELKSLCPSDQVSFGQCIAPWFETAGYAVVVFGAGLAATLIMISCTWLAPTHKREVAIATFVAGVIVAIMMGFDWRIGLAPVMSAIIAGAIVLAIVLRRVAPFSPPDNSLE